MRKMLSRLTASFTAAAIILLSPGPACYEAAGQTISRVPVNAGVTPAGAASAAAAVSSRHISPSLSGGVSLTPLSGSFQLSPAPELTGARPSVILTAEADMAIPAALTQAEVSDHATDRKGTAAVLDQVVESVPALLNPDTPEMEASLSRILDGTVPSSILEGASAQAARSFDNLKVEKRDATPVSGWRTIGTRIRSLLQKPSVQAGEKTSVPAPESIRTAAAGATGVQRSRRVKKALLWIGQAAVLSSLAAMTGTWIVPMVAGTLMSLGMTAVRHYRRGADGFMDKDRAPPAAPIRPMDWAPRILLMIALFTALDWGVKYMFLSMGLPIVYHDMAPGRVLMLKISIPLNIAAGIYFTSIAHSSTPLLERLDRWNKKHPVLGAVVKGLLWVLTFPIGPNDKRYGGDLARKDPVIGKVLGLIGILSAALVAAAFGNGLEGLLNGRVIDFIPFGRGRANLADFFIFLGMPLLWMAMDFLKRARISMETDSPLSFKTWKYFVLPVLGFLGFAYSTSAGYDAIPMPAWYVFIFSALFSAGIVLGSAVIQRFVDAYNKRFTREKEGTRG